MKNKTMRVAALLLALTLMTSCFVGGTFAKYTTAGESLDSARVAKWGVTVSADYSNLFTSQYATTSAWTGDDGVSVNASEDAVAPGTSGVLADFTVTGEPEVDVRVTYVATLKFEGGWLADTDGDALVDDEYCPIIITVNNVEYYIGKDDIDTIDKLESAVKAAIEKQSKYYNAGNALSQNVHNDLAVSWRWAFDKDSADRHPATNYQTDSRDTALGNWEKYENVKPTITLEIECTVTQVD